LNAALEAIVRHDGRLDILCCLLDGGPLAARQLSARTRGPAPLIDHWIKLLESFDLVAKIANLDGGEPLYTVTLDDHPDWVRDTIEAHRRR
jgi:hypothetical protein